MRIRRTGLYTAALAGLGGVAALAFAQSPTVSPPGGMTPPTTWRPYGNPPTEAAAPIRPSYFQPSEPIPVAPAAPPRGSGPVMVGPSGVVQSQVGVIPPPMVPTPAEGPPLTVPLPTIPTMPATLPPSVTPGPRVVVETTPDVAPPAAEAGPKVLMPGSTSIAAPASAPTGGLPSKQAPAVSVETRAPEAVTAGADFTYELAVRNDGATAVWGVRVEDDLPPGAKFVGSEPAADVLGPKLHWNLGILEPAGARKIRITLRPADEGEIRTRATVSFSTGTEARVKVTRPKLAVEISAPATARAGETVSFQITIKNTGTGPANNPLLQARLSDGLTHAGGPVLELKLPSLPAGQSKTFPLKAIAAKPGPQTCGVIVAADGSNSEAGRATVVVVEPKITARVVGPAKCLVKSEPAFLIELTNPGSAGTDPVVVTAAVPTGFELVQASDGGTLNPATRDVVWRLTGLEPGKGKAVALKLKAVAPTDAAVKILARTVTMTEPAGDGIQPVAATTRGLEVKAEASVKSEGVPALRFEVVDLEDPVEVGKEAIYEIKVVNQGTAPCTNVVVLAVPADGTNVVAATGPSTARAQGAAVTFDPVAKLDVKGETVFRVRVKGTVAGDHKFKVQVSSDQITSPITKEENTRFYKE